MWPHCILGQCNPQCISLHCTFCTSNIPQHCTLLAHIALDLHSTANCAHLILQYYNPHWTFSQLHFLHWIDLQLRTMHKGHPTLRCNWQLTLHCTFCRALNWNVHMAESHTTKNILHCIQQCMASNWTWMPNSPLHIAHLKVGRNLLQAFALGQKNELDWILWLACSPIQWHMIQKENQGKIWNVQDYFFVELWEYLYSPFTLYSFKTICCIRAIRSFLCSLALTPSFAL